MAYLEDAGSDLLLGLETGNRIPIAKWECDRME